MDYVWFVEKLKDQDTDSLRAMMSAISVELSIREDAAESEQEAVPSPMVDEAFWTIIEEIDWASKPDIDTAKKALMEKYALSTMNDFCETLSNKHSELDRASYKNDPRHQTEYVSSDGFSDTCYHIIGLGKETFEKALLIPSLIMDRYLVGEYVECLSYVVPHDHDYALLTDAGYDISVGEITKEYLAGEYSAHCTVEDVVRYLMEHDWQKAVNMYHAHFGPGYAAGFPKDEYGYLIPNVISDLEKYRLS